MSDTTRRIATGAGWLYGHRWLERLIDAVSIIILARILAPVDFGLVAIAASFVAILEGLSALDVNKALIRTRDDGSALYDTAWTLSVLRGIVSAALMLAIAPALTDGRIGAVMAALALSPVMAGLSNPRFVMFERDLEYSRVAVLTLGAKIVSFSVTLLIALAYQSYWAIVLGLLAGTASSTALSYALKPYRPRFSLTRVSDIFAFSGWLSLTSIVTTLSMETDKIIVGRLLGVGNAGLYFMTQRVGALPTRELVSPLQRILFPSFSELIEELDLDVDRLRRAVRESVNIVGTLSLPAGFGFAMVARDFVPLFLGAPWSPVVPLLEILAPFLGIRAALATALPCVMALGRTRLLFWVSFAYALVHVPLFIAGTASYGLPGAIGSIVAAGTVYVYLNAWLLKETVGISAGEIASQLARPLCAALIMVAALSLTDHVARLEPGTWLSLATRVVLGAVTFIGTQYTLWRLTNRPEGIERRLHALARKKVRDTLF